MCSLVLLSGCALQFNTRTLGVPVSMAEPLAQGVAGDSFNVTTKAVHVFWGLALAKDANLQHVLAGQLGAGSSVHNLAIHSRMRWTDVLMTALTLGVVSPMSVTFSGTIAHTSP